MALSLQSSERLHLPLFLRPPPAWPPRPTPLGLFGRVKRFRCFFRSRTEVPRAERPRSVRAIGPIYIFHLHRPQDTARGPCPGTHEVSQSPCRDFHLALIEDADRPGNNASWRRGHLLGTAQGRFLRLGLSVSFRKQKEKESHGAS